jgi:hypothetical protein
MTSTAACMAACAQSWVLVNRERAVAARICGRRDGPTTCATAAAETFSTSPSGDNRRHPLPSHQKRAGSPSERIKESPGNLAAGIQLTVSHRSCLSPHRARVDQDYAVPVDPEVIASSARSTVPSMAKRSPSDRGLEAALRTSWSVHTSSEPGDWGPENPARGQCAVTALVVQDHLGGHLLRADTSKGSHYWNRLPDGTEVDLTREQFAGDFSAGSVEERDRDYVLSFPETRSRYNRLRASVVRELQTIG